MKFKSKENLDLIEYAAQLSRLGLKNYRSIPVIKQAVQIHEEFEVETMEGVMNGKPGDFLIVGLKGELYPCDQEVFRRSYREAGADEVL